MADEGTGVPREGETADRRGDEAPIISVRGLSNSFGDQPIHEGLDLDVRRGEIIGVVGGSGTGKSVLMRSIIGLQTPAAGEIHVLGEPIIGRSEEETKDCLLYTSPSPRD